MKQISPHVYQVGLGTVNCFLIEDNGLTLVDTGTKNSVGKVFAAVLKAGRKPADIKRIILTHCHPDHSGGAAEIKRELGIPVFAHPLDAAMVEQGNGVRTPMHLSPGKLNWLVYTMFIKKSDPKIDPVIVDEHLEDDDIIPIAGGIKVIHTPGHSAGHICLLVKDEGVLIAGDICANVLGLDLSTVYEDRDLGVQSILKAASFDFDKAVFGHGMPLRDGANRKLAEKFKPM